MVVSVNGVLLWKVRDELLQYDIGKLILINPLMNDDFKKSAIRIISEKSKVSKKASIAENVQIITDETSNVIIDDNVVISNGSVIIATDNSTVHIGEQSCIGRDNIIRADSNSQVIIGQRSVIGNNNHIVSNFYSHICLEKENYGRRPEADRCDPRGAGLYGPCVLVGQRRLVQGRDQHGCCRPDGADGEKDGGAHGKAGRLWLRQACDLLQCGRG